MSGNGKVEHDVGFKLRRSTRRPKELKALEALEHRTEGLTVEQIQNGEDTRLERSNRSAIYYALRPTSSASAARPPRRPTPTAELPSAAVAPKRGPAIQAPVSSLSS